MDDKPLPETRRPTSPLIPLGAKREQLGPRPPGGKSLHRRDSLARSDRDSLDRALLTFEWVTLRARAKLA